MKCAEVNRYFDEYVDGELSPRLAESVTAHLGACQICRVEVDHLQTVRNLVQRVTVPATEGFPDGRISEAFRKLNTPPILVPPLWHRLLFGSVKIPVAAVAVALLLLLGGIVAGVQVGRTNGRSEAISLGAPRQDALLAAPPAPVKEIRVVHERIVRVPVKVKCADQTPPARFQTLAKGTRIPTRPLMPGQTDISPQPARFTTEAFLKGFEPVVYSSPRIISVKGEQ